MAGDSWNCHPCPRLLCPHPLPPLYLQPAGTAPQFGELWCTASLYQLGPGSPSPHRLPPLYLEPAGWHQWCEESVEQWHQRVAVPSMAPASVVMMIRRGHRNDDLLYFLCLSLLVSCLYFQGPFGEAGFKTRQAIESLKSKEWQRTLHISMHLLCQLSINFGTPTLSEDRLHILERSGLIILLSSWKSLEQRNGVSLFGSLKRTRCLPTNDTRW